MNILLSLSYYCPHTSGLTIYVKNLAELLTSRGHKVSIVTSQFEKELPIHEAFGEIHVHRVPVTCRISKGPMMLSYPWKVIRLIRATDIVNCHLPQFESFMIAVLAFVMNKKLIVTYHTDLSVGMTVIEKLAKMFLFFSHLITCTIADTIIVQTKDYAKNSKFLSFFSKKLAYMYPPIIPPVCSKEAEERMLLKLRKRPTYLIGFVGRLAAEKGLEYLFEAIPRIQRRTHGNFLIAIAGPEAPIGENAYWQKVNRLGQKYKDHVIFLKWLSAEELGAFYSLIDVLVLPSTNVTEAFGMVQIEAMLMGTPVIATNLPGVRIPVQKTGMGKIVVKQDSYLLAQAIIQVLKNKTKYVKKKEVILKEFSFTNTLDSYQELIHKA